MFGRFLFLGAFIGLFVLSAETIASLQRNCWDGTFNYRVGSLSVYSDLVEIGINSSFGFNWETSGEPIVDESGIDISSSLSVYLAFPLADCISNGGNYTCQAAVISDTPLANTAFIKREVDNRYQTLNVPVEKVEVTFGQYAVEITISKTNLSGPSIATTRVGLGRCSLTGYYGHTYFGFAQLPEDLRARVRDSH